MKKITTALLAMCCMPVTGMTAAAETKYDPLDFGWGTATWAAVEGLKPINDHGMFTSAWTTHFTQVYLKGNDIVMLGPRMDTLRFIVRDDVDPDEAADVIADTVDAYIPGIRQNAYVQYDRHFYSCDKAKLEQTTVEFMHFDNYRAFELWVADDVENTAEIESGIQLALAQKHLISEFYGFGETANYQVGHLDSSVTTLYSFGRKDCDWEGAQAYLAEQYPDYTLEPVDEGSYQIVGAEKLGRGQQLELIGELWEKFNTPDPIMAVEPSEGEFTVGHNALERKGDVDLDTALTIVDVIALNRNLMANDPLCDTAKKNADINGDGTPDEADSLAILKEIVEITKDFQAQ